MKQCPKCQEKFEDNPAFCPSCGTKTLDVPNESNDHPKENQARYCPNCGSACQEETAFCPQCGKPLNLSGVLALQDLSLPTEPPVDEVHEWEFKYSPSFMPGTKYTRIIANGTRLSVEQYGEFFVKYGKKADQFDVKDITSIMQEKKIAFTSVIEIIIGLLLLLTRSIIGVLFLGLGIWGFRDKYIIIQHKHGGIRIRDAVLIGSNREDFLNYVRRYNPDCIRVFLS